MSTYTNGRGKRPMWPLALVAVLLVAAGVAIGVMALQQDDDGQAVTVDQARDIQASVAALPKCADVFKANAVIDEKKASAGCLDANGGVQVVGNFRCTDGRHLWQVDAATGAKAGWGFGGQKYRLSANSASDPAYKAAYEECVG